MKNAFLKLISFIRNLWRTFTSTFVKIKIEARILIEQIKEDINDVQREMESITQDRNTSDLEE